MRFFSERTANNIIYSIFSEKCEVKMRVGMMHLNWALALIDAGFLELIHSIRWGSANSTTLGFFSDIWRLDICNSLFIRKTGCNDLVLLKVYIIMTDDFLSTWGCWLRGSAKILNLCLSFDSLDLKENSRAAIKQSALELAVWISDPLFGGFLPVLVLILIVIFEQWTSMTAFKSELRWLFQTVLLFFKICAQLLNDHLLIFTNDVRSKKGLETSSKTLTMPETRWVSFFQNLEESLCLLISNVTRGTIQIFIFWLISIE